MDNSPKYFEGVRAKAAQRWDQFERDEELAAASWQLFAQVQNPRHVVSELLQNADDAGATEATVEIKEGEFVFSHDGDDFIEDNFASLCRFGYSNKRTMQTIGFRGIGFKSTFSLGDEVHLVTPTLSVMFQRKRFYEPRWIDRRRASSGTTEVRVRIKDKHRLTKLQENLSEWIKTPASLLFFKTIRKLRIQDEEVHWKSHGRGPVDDSEWMATSKSPRQKYLVLRSAFEEFPSEAQEEIRDERRVGVEGKLDLPPCQVELVLGPDRGPDLEGRLFVVLPTQVTTTLPFACNAPFIQDPVRLQIKDPAISPTNRWLLERVGQFAGSAMIEWLSSMLGVEERCRAYSLFPDVDPDDEFDVDDEDQRHVSLKLSCEKTIQEAFDSSIDEKAFLLPEQGKLRPQGGCVALPAPLVDVWSESAISELLGDEEKPILNRHISEENVQRLVHRKYVAGLDKDDVVRRLKPTDYLGKPQPNPPKPKTSAQLLQLWSFIADEVTQNTHWTKEVRIFPTKGSDELHQATDVIRVAEKKLLRSSDDWEFLSKYARVLDQNWLRFLAKQRRKAEANGDKPLLKQVKAAYAILKALELNDASEVGQLIENATRQFVADEESTLKDCVRMAHIAAHLGAPVPEAFEFITRDRVPTPSVVGVLATTEKDVAEFAPAEWFDEHVLHNDYWNGFTVCTESAWRAWIASEESKLVSFVPLKPLDEEKATVKDQLQIEELLRNRGATKPPKYTYHSLKFQCDDWDFDERLWQHWQAVASKDENFWTRLLRQILGQTRRFWSEKMECKVQEMAKRGGWKEPITNEKLRAGWIAKLRELPCLEDTNGKPHPPSGLLLRTKENESFLSVEAFIQKDFDTPENRPLLEALGVQTQAEGAERLLDRLRHYTVRETPPIDDVLNLYRGLDRMLLSDSAKILQHVHDVFAKEAFSLTANAKWSRSGAVYRGSNETEIPGAEVLHQSVRHLTMWSKIGVAMQPTVELVLEQLNRLDSGQRLSEIDLRFVHSSLCQQHPERIWIECGHWLNLEGEWAPVKSLSYALTDNSFPWEHLCSQVKKKTADFRRLQIEPRQNPPFSNVTTLADCLEERPAKLPSQLKNQEVRPWLTALGAGLRRIQNHEDSDRIREFGKRLAVTAWQVVPEIEIVPFIDGQRAGDPRPAEAFWSDAVLSDAVLYVANRAVAKMPKPIAGLLGRGFGTDILDAINFCYDREPAKVMVYLEANFSLAPREEMEPEDFDAVNSDDSGDEDDFDTSHTGSAGPTTTADAIQSLLGDSATSQTPLPGELDRPTSSRTGSGAGTRGSSPTDDDENGDGRERTGSGGKGSSGTKHPPSGRSTRQFISYVATHPNEEEPDPDGLQHEARMALEEKAIQLILAREPKLKRTPINNKGFDLFEGNTDVGPPRRIEVKAMKGDLRSRPVGISHEQFECARLNGKSYWLYVVEHADNPQTARIVRIQDPAGKARTFCFDHGWISVAEADGPETDEGDAEDETTDESADVDRHPQEG